MTSPQVGNPVHAYNLMRRFTIDLPSIERDLGQDDWAGEECFGLVSGSCIVFTFIGPYMQMAKGNPLGFL